MPSPHPSTVLIIEDEAAIRYCIQYCCRRLGYQTVSRGNGDDLETVFQQNKIDLLILDLLLPDGNGVEIIPLLKSKYPHLKIIAISGGNPQHDPNHFLQEAQAAGADAMLPKPFEISELVDHIRRLTARI